MGKSGCLWGIKESYWCYDIKPCHKNILKYENKALKTKDKEVNKVSKTDNIKQHKGLS